MTLQTDVPVTMRDGVVLRADVYMPTAVGKFPVLLVRTPYDKSGEAETCTEAAQRGYVCVAQDVRGRYGSEGEWYPFKHESDDGYDTVEWAASLPNSSGKVAMFGESYVGATQWLAAIAVPPHLIAIQPSLTASDYHEGWVYQGGALEQWFDQSWTSILAAETLSRTATRQTTARDWTVPLPLSGYPVLRPVVSSSLVPYYFDWLAHPDYDSYWRQWSIEQHYSQMPIGAYHVGGWYDVFLRGTLHNYVGMRKQANSAWARNHQRLMIGPWIHDGPKDGKAGEIDFGSSAAFHPEDGPVPWYDELFKNAPPAQTKPVKLFVMGINEWREEDDWPLPQTQYRRYYFRSDGHANSSSGNGELATEMPKHESSDTFTYDPSNPVPTRGGNLCCSHDNDRISSGAYDQRETERRPDVLVYTTPAFARDLEVTGPLLAELYVSSSAEDTDITAKIVDVWPNGYALNLADGIQRLRYRSLSDKPELMHPGTIYKVAIDLGATSNVFRAGHRLRIEISSSNFPHFDRNLNTGESPEQGSRFVKAQNRIYHDAEHASAVILPVIPPK